MRATVVWADKVHDKNSVPQVIYAVAFKPDGTQLIAGAGNRVLVYETADGQMVSSLRGHKGTVYCLAYQKDGKRFASGAADKDVIIWNENLEGLLKYNHNDAIQCLAFNPVSHVLASCTASDYGFWSSEVKAVNKTRVNSRICCASWTNDGKYIALGMANGVVSIRNKSGEKVVITRPGGAAVWSLAWNPSKADTTDILCVCDWNQRMSFYMLSGRQIGRDKVLDYDPCCMSYFTKGDFIVVGGSNKKASLYTREGVRLHTVCDLGGWVWTCAVRPKQNYVAVGCRDGTIALYQLIFSTVHGLYKDRYAFRSQMTDVVIQDLTTQSEARIRCRDLVKKIAIYKDRMAVQLPNQINIYEIGHAENGDADARILHKIKQKIECNLLVVCSRNIILCHEKRLQCLSFEGVKEKQWQMDSLIRYIKVTGGPAGREGLLVGLRNGQILKIFVDNAFPIELIKQKSAVRCLDLSSNRKKLAVVDDNNLCLVYDLISKELLFSEPHANSVSWNTQNEEMLCFSGNGMLHIKAGDFPIHEQKMQGFVVGFQGSHIYCLHVYAMIAVDVPQSHSMYQYLKQKRFDEAYRIACLGVTPADWSALGIEALECMNLGIAKNCFIRTRNLRYLDLIHSILERKKRPEYIDDEIFLADVYAHQGKFELAAELYEKNGNANKALQMYSDLCMFDKAKQFMNPGDAQSARALMQKQAEWSKSVNDPSVMVDILIHAGEIEQAIDLMGKSGMHSRLIEKARSIDAAEVPLLQRIAQWLGKLGHVPMAAEVYNRISDDEGLVNLYVNNNKWSDAFALAERNPNLREAIYLPYGNSLAEKDKYEEAQEAFRKAGHPEKAIEVLEVLTHNAVLESRFGDAGYYYWQLSMAALAGAEDVEANDPYAEECLNKFEAFQRRGNLYYAYESIQRYIIEPFTAHQPLSLFNIARYLLHGIQENVPLGISKVSVLYSLAKQSRNLGAFKLARHAYQALQGLKVPMTIREQVDLGMVSIQSKPFSDSEDVLTLCYRCSSSNALLDEKSKGMLCSECKQPFVFSGYSFDVLPLIEFQLEENLNDEEAMKAIENDSNVGASSSETDRMDMESNEAEDGFSVQLMQFTPGEEFSPIIVDEKMLCSIPSSEIFIQQYPKPLRPRYYRNVLAEISVSQCETCNKFFHTDDYELLILQEKMCPFCRTKVSIQRNEDA
eukprot:m.103931 g.103931  ORF g.103931 m.103931 type:complete len:1184 (+) comp13828_c0_seq5:52-3603(+)